MKLLPFHGRMSLLGGVSELEFHIITGSENTTSEKAGSKGKIVIMLARNSEEGVNANRIL